MIEVLNLALPYFGLILLGFVCGRTRSVPAQGLAWMDFFIVYLSLPALFFLILARTPFEQLTNVRFILVTTLCTFIVLALSFVVAFLATRRIGDASIGALAGAYGNIGYMGPGLVLATVGAKAAAPIALIFCFETLLFFSLLPAMMAVAQPTRRGALRVVGEVARKILLHPFVVATALGVAAAALQIHMPVALERLLTFLQNASAPCALFTLGVTVALRPLTKVPAELPLLVLIKLVLHPILAFALLAWLGPFDLDWMQAAILMAALPPALNVFVLGRQYRTWIEPASGAVLLGTLVSVFTLTFVMWLVQNGHLAAALKR